MDDLLDPLANRFQDKLLRIDFDKVMSFGHKSSATFQLPPHPRVAEMHAVIKKDLLGTQEIFSVVPKEGRVRVKTRSGHLADVDSRQGLVLRHGNQILIGPHAFRVVDEERMPEFSTTERRLLNDVLKRFNRPAASSVSAMYVYADEYFANPYQLNRIQNQIISKAPAKTQRGLARAAVTLNAKIEQAHHQADERIPTPNGYAELYSQNYLFHGDILPGRAFRLGHLQTYDREILEIRKLKEDTGHPQDLLVKAREWAARRPSDWELVHWLHQRIAGTPYRNAPVSYDVRAGPVTFVEEWGGGVCRHKAALLAMCLQEAGIPCRYVRGNFGDQGHAWVETRLHGRTYLFDPTQGRVLDITFGYPEQPPYSRFTPSNVVWRPHHP